MRILFIPYRVLFLCICVVISLGLVGCGPKKFHTATVNYSEDAANVYVSAYPPIPWSDISANLEPKNNLSMADARTLAAQSTLTQISQFYSTFAAGLGIGLPVKSGTLTTQLAADGTESTTGTKTFSYGNVPTSSGTPSSTISNTTISPSLSTSITPGNLDGNTYLTAASALYQQAQILDSQISKGVLPKGYQANLITLQVNLQPKQRDVSYDAYIDVSLLPSRWKEAVEASDAVNSDAGGRPPVIIYPLIIMDAIETSSVGRTIEIMRQAALSLSGVIGQIGVNAGVSGGTVKADSIVGLDKNSLITVGRLSDHTIRIRLGAANSGSAGLALVPRDYNVSLVVLTRWDEKAIMHPKHVDPIRVLSLEAITHTSFVSTEDGSVLISGPKRSRLELAKKVHDMVCQFYNKPVVNECAGYEPPKLTHKPPPCPDPDYFTNYNYPTLTSFDFDANLELLRAVDRADYRHVATCLPFASDLKKPNVIEDIKLQRLLSNLIEIQSDARYSTFRIELQELSEPKLPDETQIALYSDDKKKATAVVLRGGKGLNPKILEASLILSETRKLRNITEKLQLHSSEISMTSDGTEIDISFPSLNQLGLVPINTKLDDFPLFLSLSSDQTNSARYKISEILVTEVSGTPNPVRATSAVLIADQTHVAQVTLQVGTFNAKIKGPGHSIQLKIDGADVRPDPQIGASAITSNGVPITEKSVVTLKLGALSPDRLVTVTTMDYGDGSKPPVAIGEPLTFIVDIATGKAK